MDKNQIWKIYGTAYKEMTERILDKADLAGLIGSRDKKICIKPNLVTASPAEFGGTTHPEVVEGILTYLGEHGFKDLVIAEGSWVGDRTREAIEICGYKSLCERYKVPFIDTQREKSHSVDCAGMELNVVDFVDSIDFLINVPVLKGHCQTKITCALKNLKGLIPNSEKSRFHTMGLHKPIAHLQTAIKQDFIVVDHICGDLDFEEGGNPVVRNCVMAGLDPVLIDSYVCSLLGYETAEVPYITFSEQLGIGKSDLGAAEIINLGLYGESSQGSLGACQEIDELPRERKLLEVSYAVTEANSCSACYASLVGALWRLREEGILEKLDTTIGIGQGMRGKTGVLGIGRCTKDFDYSLPGCPPSEDAIYEGLKKYINGD
ncbi:MAG: DUF362 domain-containing protein [Lachnospiraceae bacterium]|nr:DUF362 domain-containing protein [Lachnospiraceae bacterium]